MVLFLAAFSVWSFGATPDRITGAIASGQFVKLPAGVSMKAKPQYDRGLADPSFKLGYVTLLTVPSASQHSALLRLLTQQQDPHSPLYHQWLTPEQYADRFGLSQNDINKITQWLKSQGFTVLSVPRDRSSVIFSGTVAQIQTALHTEIHRFEVDGEWHTANVSVPAVPTALANIVTGFRGLNDFRMKPLGGSGRLHHDFYDSNFATNFIAPGDVATIYDISPLYTAGFDGTGQTLAVMGQTDVYLADITNFRSGFNLPAISGCTTDSNGILTACNTTNLQYVLVGTDPGAPSAGDLGEADLDIEWSGATASNAQIIYVNAETSNGVNDALAYAVSNDIAPVISMSYGLCELGEALNGTLSSDEARLQEANAEGITFVNSSGDVSAAACDGFTNPSTNPPNLAVYGLQVNYPASSPETTAVGGTALPYNDLSGSPFWTTSNGSTGGSALEYIPEQGWNDDYEFAQFCIANSSNKFCTQGGSTPVSGWVPITDARTAQEDIGIGGSGGGASACTTLTTVSGNQVCHTGFSQPSWQAGMIPSGTAREVPDVALMSSPNFPGYIFCTPLSELGGSGTTSSCANGIQAAIDNNLSIIGGTSVATPVFAGIVTLLNQYLAGSPSPGLGNINPTLYSLAQNTHPTPFHLINSGNNYVACEVGTPAITGWPSNLQCPGVGYLGYNASSSSGYTEVAGLGSVDANALAVAWAAGRTSSSLALQASASQIATGQSVTFTATLTTSTTAVGQISFFNNGSTTALGTGTLNNSGVATFATTSLPIGTNNITASFPGDGNNASATSSAVQVVVAAPQFTLSTPIPSSASTPAGQSSSSTFTVTPSGGQSTFAEAVAFACGGLPDSTVTCSFTPTSISAGSGATPVTVKIQTSGPSGAAAPNRRRADNRMPWLPLTLPLAGIVMLGLSGRKISEKSATICLCISLVMAGVLVACGGSSNPVAVTVTPTTATVFPSYASWPAGTVQTASFTASVTNTSNTAVTWAVTTTNGGSVSGGSYTAPAIALGLPSSATVTATSQADTTKTASATVTITPTTVPTAVAGAPYPITVTATEGPTSNTTSAISLTVQ